MHTYLFAGANQVDIALLLLREILGVFFFLSGFHKLFYAERRASMQATMQEFFGEQAKRPLWAFVSSIEFLAGGALIIGLLAPLAACGLLAVSLVAMYLTCAKQIAAMRPIDLADWVDCLLFLPEPLYVTFAAAIVLCGPGAYSLDAIILASL